MDTAYGRRWIRRIRNYEYAFSCQDLALIRRNSFPGYGVNLQILFGINGGINVTLFDVITPSCNVTPTLALANIPANVKGDNGINTATEDPPSHIEGEIDAINNANKQEKPEETEL
ncbi:hypothetical protein Tco_1479278 [Tanacetum coccineum]